MKQTWREKLGMAMEDRGFSQYRLGKETGLQQSRVSLWLKGKGVPSMEEWVLMSQALDVPIAWFYGDDETIPMYRKPEEQMLVRIARRVGIDNVLELLVRAGVDALGSAEDSIPPAGPLKSIRTRTVDLADQPENEDGPVEPRKGKPGRKPKSS